MTTRTKNIDEMKKLERKINMWNAVARWASKMADFARSKSDDYLYVQNAIIDELTVESYKAYIEETKDEEARKERNRHTLKAEIDL